MVPVVRALIIHCRSRVLKGTSTRLVPLSRSLALSGYITWCVVLAPTSFSKPVVRAWFILHTRANKRELCYYGAAFLHHPFPFSIMTFLFIVVYSSILVPGIIGQWVCFQENSLPRHTIQNPWWKVSDDHTYLKKRKPKKNHQTMPLYILCAYFRHPKKTTTPNSEQSRVQLQLDNRCLASRGEAFYYAQQYSLRPEP